MAVVSTSKVTYTISAVARRARVGSVNPTTQALYFSKRPALITMINTPVYDMRAWDSGISAYVYWTSTSVPITSPVTTHPQYTGTLSGVVIVGVR